MRRRLIALMLAVAILITLVSPAYGDVPKVTADAAMLMDVRTGQILYEKNAHQKKPPASTTKIITALLAIEKGKQNDMVTIGPNAAYTEDCSMEFKVGENISLESLLYGALLWSSNGACVAIAEYIGGDEKNFVGMMNAKAKALGALNTHFTNTNGLPDPNHYSTVYDLAVIARQAMKNPIFARMVSTKFKLVAAEQDQWPLDNTNRLLWSYEGADGVKTGTTNAAGLCLVSSATRRGRQVIAVVLHSDDRYGDSIRLLDHGFHDFKIERLLRIGHTYGSVKVIDGKLEQVAVTAKENVDAAVPITDDGAIQKKIELKTALLAPLAKGQVVGQYDIYYRGEKIAGTPLVTMSAMKEASILQKINRFFKKIFS